MKIIKGDRFEALYVMALTMGLRQGELLGLHWTDVDLKGLYLTVRRRLSEVRGWAKIGGA